MFMSLYENSERDCGQKTCRLKVFPTRDHLVLLSDRHKSIANFRFHPGSPSSLSLNNRALCNVQTRSQPASQLALPIMRLGMLSIQGLLFPGLALKSVRHASKSCAPKHLL